MRTSLTVRSVLVLCVASLIPLTIAGCMTWAVDTFSGPRGVRFNGDLVQEKVMSSVVVRQKYTPLQWENDGRYASYGRRRWWREIQSGVKIQLHGTSRLEDLDVVFYPMTGTNGWLGVGGCAAIPIIDDVVGKDITLRMHPKEYGDELRVAKRFSSKPNLPMPEEDAEKAYDPFLFDGNKRLMYRTFNPDEQYYEYDALRETLRPVTTNRVAEVKRTYTDLYRIPVGGQFRYWKEDANGQLRPDFKYYHPFDPVKDAVPKW